MTEKDALATINVELLLRLPSESDEPDLRIQLWAAAISDGSTEWLLNELIDEFIESAKNDHDPQENIRLARDYFMIAAERLEKAAQALIPQFTWPEEGGSP